VSAALDHVAAADPPSTAAAAVSIESVAKRYGPPGSSVLALERISLSVQRGEFVCLVGASGCGKTTLLNLVSGLDQPDAGRITVTGRVALLFQEAALFPWLTAAANVELPMTLRGVPRTERRERVADLLDLVHLQGFADRQPHELSGGMRQRVALARALAQRAEVLLMDEPFGSLDAMTRDILHDELERLWISAGFTVLFVTHDVREAVRLGDRVDVLSSRPARVVEEIKVPLPRPRQGSAPELGDLAEHVIARLRKEVRAHASG
jgi:NitT/TauT family transport system ATP-binding protein